MIKLSNKNHGKASQQTKNICQRNPNQSHKTGPGIKLIGTGFTKHPVEFSKNNHTPRPSARMGGPSSGHSFNFTASSWPCQPVNPCSCRSEQCARNCGTRLGRELEVEDFGRTAAADLPHAHPLPCEEQHYSVVRTRQNRPPPGVIAAGQLSSAGGKPQG